MTPALGFVFGIEAEVHQRVVALAGFHDDIAAAAAVAAGRAAARHELLAPEGHAAVAAVAGLHRILASSMNMSEQWLVDSSGPFIAVRCALFAICFSCKPYSFVIPTEDFSPSRGICGFAAVTKKASYEEAPTLDVEASGSKLVASGFLRHHRHELAELPRSLNSTMPVILANRVSSLPRPTFSPGFMRVPRCRTMMEPPETSWPPNDFTPSRCALESRPLRELPKPFLCAISQIRFGLRVSSFAFLVERVAVSSLLLRVIRHFRVLLFS